MEDQASTMVLTSEIVANYVANNSVAMADLPALIATVSKALNDLGKGETVVAEPEASKPSSAQVRKSIRTDGLVSFVDGKTYKTLKRHLATHGMTPDSYKSKFGLPKDYPMTSPEYSAARSAMAKSIGLGRKAGETAPKRGAKKKA